jgi:hypothetical protein
MNAPMMARRTQQSIRVLLGLVLVGFVIQLAVTVLWREPYPGLFQPSFGSGQVRDDGTTIVREPIVTVTYADGGTATFTHRQVMAESKSLQLTVFRSAFGADSPRRADPETIAWLQRRLSVLAGGREPEQAVLVYMAVAYDVSGQRPPEARTTDRTVISFGGDRG